MVVWWCCVAQRQRRSCLVNLQLNSTYCFGSSDVGDVVRTFTHSFVSLFIFSLGLALCMVSMHTVGFGQGQTGSVNERMNKNAV